MVKHLATTVKF